METKNKMVVFLETCLISGEFESHYFCNITITRFGTNNLKNLKLNKIDYFTDLFVSSLL